MIRKREPENEIVPRVRYGFSSTAERLGHLAVSSPVSNEIFILDKDKRKKSPRTSNLLHRSGRKSNNSAFETD